MKLSTIFGEWELDRRELIEAVTPLTEGQLNWIPEGGLHCIAGLLRHIAEAEWGWCGNVILGHRDYRDITGEDAPESADILRELERTHKYTLEALDRYTVDDISREFPIPGSDEILPLLRILWHTYEHEMRHRGQIFMLMRLQGIKPPNV